MKYTVATANIAGGARLISAHPKKYKILGKKLLKADIMGIQEVIRVYDGDNVIRDDIDILQKAHPGMTDYQSFFFPSLDSMQHSHPDKWNSDKFCQYYAKGYRIQEGMAILVKNEHPVYDFWSDHRQGGALGVVLPWYLDKPSCYLGNRDTQPRTIMLVRVRLGGKYVLFASTHLTTLKGERSDAKDDISLNAQAIREKQINWIVEYIESYQTAFKTEPLILLGDFNCEPKSSALAGLKKLDLKLMPFCCGYTHRTHKIAIDLIYSTIENAKAKIIDLDKFGGSGISDHNPVIGNFEL